MENDKNKLSKGLTYLGITLPLMFLAPFLINLGFRGLGRDQTVLGVILLILGFLLGFAAIAFMVLALRSMLDHFFSKK